VTLSNMMHVYVASLAWVLWPGCRALVQGRPLQAAWKTACDRTYGILGWPSVLSAYGHGTQGQCEPMHHLACM